MMLKTIGFVLGLTLAAGAAYAEAALKVKGKAYSVAELATEQKGAFYDLEKKKYELIEQLGQEKYLEAFFGSDEARRDYLAKNAKVTDAEIQATLARFKDHPQLKERSEAERKQAITDYLQQGKEREVLTKLLSDAVAKKELEIVYPEPQEPVYALQIGRAEPVRYGPAGQEAAAGCTGDACPITVVEYSDFECPFCARVQPAAQKVLAEYRGRIRWIVRDMPLEMHARARPAAVAAHCAGEQGKFWPMYDELFRSQANLADEDLKKHAAKLGLEEKAFASCLAKPDRALTLIDGNVRGGAKLGVSGTPTYFVNGRRVSGALSFENFKGMIEPLFAKK